MPHDCAVFQLFLTNLVTTQLQSCYCTTTHVIKNKTESPFGNEDRYLKFLEPRIAFPVNICGCVVTRRILWKRAVQVLELFQILHHHFYHKTYNVFFKHKICVFPTFTCMALVHLIVAISSH